MYLSSINTPSLDLENNISLARNVQSIGPELIRCVSTIKCRSQLFQLCWAHLSTLSAHLLLSTLSLSRASIQQTSVVWVWSWWYEGGTHLETGTVGPDIVARDAGDCSLVCVAGAHQAILRISIVLSIALNAAHIPCHPLCVLLIASSRVSENKYLVSTYATRH